MQLELDGDLARLDVPQHAAVVGREAVLLDRAARLSRPQAPDRLVDEQDGLPLAEVGLLTTHHLQRSPKHAPRTVSSGEKTARDDKPQWTLLGLTKDDVDLYSGWEQKTLSKNMQIHYAGQQRDHRVKRCAIKRST